MTEGTHTGDARVDEALAVLQQGRQLPLAEQVAAFEAAHRALQDVLSNVDDS